jgi:ribonuclease HI
VIKTDASKAGWGVYAPYRNDSLYRFGGRWAPQYADTHINTLETIAATIGLEYALADTTNKHVRLRADNTTAISVIKKSRNRVTLGVTSETIGLRDCGISFRNKTYG